MSELLKTDGPHKQVTTECLFEIAINDSIIRGDENLELIAKNLHRIILDARETMPHVIVSQAAQEFLDKHFVEEEVK